MSALLSLYPHVDHLRTFLDRIVDTIIQVSQESSEF